MSATVKLFFNSPVALEDTSPVNTDFDAWNSTVYPASFKASKVTTLPSLTVNSTNWGVVKLPDATAVVIAVYAANSSASIVHKNKYLMFVFMSL